MKNRKFVKYIYRGVNKVPVYEKISDPFETKWRIVDYDDALGLPITSKEVVLFNKKNYNCCLYSTSFCLPVLITTAIFWIGEAMSMTWSESDKIGTYGVICISSSLVSAIAGGIWGYMEDKRETIKAIKKGRQLKLVE